MTLHLPLWLVPAPEDYVMGVSHIMNYAFFIDGIFLYF